MLVRRIARPMLAAPFVFLGVDALRNPGPRVAAARPVVEKVAEQADKQLPVQVSQDVEQWVKINAGVMVGAGGLLGLGRLPRLSALLLTGSMVPTTAAGHRFWEKQGAERQQQLIHFLKNLGLVGALLIAAVDTEGRPSVGYRARRAARRATDATEKQLTRAQRKGEKVQKRAAKQAERARRQARKQAKKVTS